MINKQRLIDRFCKMVGISSISGKEGAFRDFLISEFAQRGFSAVEDEAGRNLGGESGNLLVRVPGTIEAPALLLAAHMDTVVPGEDIQANVGEDGFIRSVGDTILASDDKAGIAAILEALDVIQEDEWDHPPLELLFTVGEEHGLQGAKVFDFSAIQAPIAYVLDSGGKPGSIVIQSPCQNEIEYSVVGKAAHAGINPEDGLNAIQVMAMALSQMPCGRIDADTTCNFGTIAGGQARNIVAAECRVKGEARSLHRDRLNELTEKLKQLFISEVRALGAIPEYKVTFLYPEISLEENEEVVIRAVRAAEAIGMKAVLQSTGGGSDAAVINGRGIRCANLGIGMTDAHTTHESIHKEDLVNDARWVLEIIRQSSCLEGIR